MRRLYIIPFLLLYLVTSCNDVLPKVDYKLKNASVRTSGNKLIVSTGKVERIWQLTSAGLITVAFNEIGTNKTTHPINDKYNADWSYYGLIENKSKAILVDLRAHPSTDENFTSEHIEIIAEFEYPEVESSIKYIIWAYPDAPGIRTQVLIKGKAEEYISKPNIKKREDIQFEVISGKNKNNYAAEAIAERSITSSLEDNESVQIHAKGMDQKKKYKLGFTWWDYAGTSSEQDVWVSSVDGEISIKVLDQTLLPDFKNKKENYKKIIVDLPGETLLDGTCRIFFNNKKGRKAQVSEIFIFEEGNDEIEITNGLIERITEIKKSKHEGYFLKGYMNCGEAIQGEKMIATGRVDYIPYSVKGSTRTHIGYYNDTQHRNRPETPILKEQINYNVINESEKVNWSNIIRIDSNDSGIIMVKESHKCANQYGVETGEFIVENNGVCNTGTALFPSDIIEDEYKWCWPSWSIIYTGGAEGAELALKEFDRFRFPVDVKRDIYIQANTWGSGRSREASKEENILLELESQADLGIDIQQIDDGWQTKDWSVRKDWYPEGWINVVAKAKETGVKIGLWAAAMPVTYDALKMHYDSAHFETYKLDFASLGNHKNMDKLIGKIRKFIKYTDHNVRVNWDLTENAPRFGYFWAREFGCIYLENRKPMQPENVVYIPHLVLRDIWQVAKYTNINKFQTSIQNIEMTNRKMSDAYLHSHSYSVAIGLIGTPLFFQETHNYNTEARNQIRALLATYKQYRDEMYDSYVFPIGEEPNNASWSGFQWYKSNRNTGYLMIFRELNNTEPMKEMALHFLKNTNIKVTNLETGEFAIQKINEHGKLQLNIEKPAGYKFIKYEIVP